jgi:PAS domain S-box-containing protein
MTILIVEDDAGLSELIKENTDELGYQTDCVQSGKEAIYWLEKQQPYLMILDYSLLDMNGKELISELEIKGQSVPSFIVSTGQGDERIAVEMMKLGARDYIVKDRYFLERLPEVILRVCREIENENKRLLAEAALKTSEEKYRVLFETMPNGFYRSTPEGYFIDVNPAFVKMLGYESKEELLKVYIPNDIYVYTDERDVINENNDDFITNVEIYRLKTKDGSIIWIEDNARYIKDKNGKVIFNEGICRDITKRKYAEELLQKQNKEIEVQYEQYMQLNEVLRQTNYELEIEKEHAEESDRLKTAFLQNISHEIRTPLNGILGYAKLLQNDSILKEEIKEFTEIIYECGNRLIEIVNNILEISKIETGQIKIQKKIFSINSLIYDLYSLFSHNAIEKGLKLNYHTNSDDEKCTIYSDESKLNQILYNLINNSLKFTITGGIDYGYEIRDNSILFFVKDTGIGISAEHQKTIFDQFTQIDLSITRGYEGTGIGLAICKGLGELLGGKIWVESKVGKGSTFYFSLPK